MRNERLIHIQFSPERSLQEQIKEHVLENIKQGVYGDKALPSCRKMASMLRVSRNTVVLVYEKLVDEGFLFSSTAIFISCIYHASPFFPLLKFCVLTKTQLH